MYIYMYTCIYIYIYIYIYVCVCVCVSIYIRHLLEPLSHSKVEPPSLLLYYSRA